MPLRRICSFLSFYIDWIFYLATSGRYLARLFLRAAPMHPRQLPYLPVEVLTEIFQFATYVYECESIMPLDPVTLCHPSINALGPNTTFIAMRTKCALVLVNHAWRQIATPLLYRDLVVRSPSRAERILLSLEARYQLTNNSSLTKYGQFVRHLEIYTHSRGSRSTFFLRTLCTIIHNCPNLRIISGTWMHPLPPGFLETVSRMCGPTLQGISWSSTCRESPEIGSFFSSFQTLQVLDISGITFSPEYVESQPPFQLPLVHDLVLSTRPEDLSFATLIYMPQLRKLVLRVIAGSCNDQMKTFLESCAGSIRALHILPPLDFDPEDRHLEPLHDFHIPFLSCPYLETVAYHVNHTPTFQHPSLRCVYLQGVRMDGLDPSRSTKNKTNVCLATLLNQSLYPCLETVRTVDFFMEVENLGTTMDLFIWWSERFENRGADFQDGSGIVWLYTEVTNGD